MTFIAQKIFVGRDDHKATIRRNLEELEQNNTKKILSFYGAGGQGKSTLCDEFRLKMLPEYEESIVSVHSDFDIHVHQNPADCMEHIRKVLGEKLSKKFIAFDIAFLKYKALTTDLEFVKSRYKYMFRFNNSLINDSVDIVNEFASEIPGIRVVFNWLRNWSQDYYFEHLKSSEEILKHYNIDILDAQKILPLLPIFLAADLNKILKEKQQKLLLTFDAYEKLWHNAPTKSGYGADSKDQWIKTIFENVDSDLLLATFGRDQLRWDGIKENCVEKYYIGGLSDQDCETFLLNVPIERKAIRDWIIASSEGLPFYLDLQVNIYQEIVNSGKQLSVHKFGASKEEVIKKFFNHIGDYEQDTLSILAIPVSINKELFLYLRKQGYIVPKTRKYEDILRHSFFQSLEDEKSSYLMHGIIKSHLENDMRKDDIELYKEVNKCLFDFFNGKAQPIIKDNLQHEQIDNWVQMATTHLLNYDLKLATTWLSEFYPYAKKNLKLELAENLLFQALLAIQMVENYPKYLLDCYCNIQYLLVEVWIKRGKYHQAVVTAERLFRWREMALEMSPDLEPLELIFTESELVNTFIDILVQLNQYDKAKRYNIGRNKGTLQAYNQHRITGKMRQADISQSIAWDLYFQKFQQRIEWPDSIISNIMGNALFKAGRIEASKKFYHKSLDLVNKENLLNKAVALWCLGKAYKNSDLELSNEYLTKCLDLYHQLLRIDHPHYLQSRGLLLWNEISGEGIENIETDRIKSLVTEIFYEDPYNPWFYEFILFIAEQLVDIEPTVAHLLVKLSIESLTFKYGSYFKPLVPFITYCKEQNIDLERAKETWSSTINKLNEFQVRRDNFLKLDITDEKFIKVKQLLETHGVISAGDGELFCFSVPFYKSNVLVEIKFIDHSIFALSDGDSIQFLNSFRTLFDTPLCDDLSWDPNDLKSYVRLYFDSIVTSLGRIFLIEEVKDLKWSSDLADINSLPNHIFDLIGPLQFIEETEDGIKYHATSLIYNNQIYSADLLVQKNGQIYIDNENQIAPSKINFEIVFPDSTSSLSIVNFLEKIIAQLPLSKDIEAKIIESISQIRSSFDALSILEKTPLSIRKMQEVEIPEDFLKKMQGNSPENIHIDAFKLSFCNHHYLVRIFNVEENGFYYFISDLKEVVLNLDWTSSAFHKLVEQDFVFNETTAGDYLRLFCEFLKGDVENTRFAILEEDEPFTFHPLDGDDDKVNDAKTLIQPLKLIEQGEDYFMFESDSMLNMNSNLSYVKMTVYRDGSVEMLKDQTLIADILILPKEFEQDIKNLNKHYQEIENNLQKVESLLFASEHAWLPKLLLDNVMGELKHEIESIYNH